MIPEHRKHLQRIKARLSDPALLERDEAEQSVHAKLYCVELSGVLEHMVRDCCVAYTKKCANDNVQKFMIRTAERFPNPNVKNISRIIKNFSDQWDIRLQDFWDGEIKDAVGSLVGNRHLIAHGRDCNISIVRVKEWHRSVEKLSNFVWEEIFQLNQE